MDSTAAGLRVLLIALSNEGFGGLETHVLNLCKRLAARGNKVVLLAIENSPLHQRAKQEGFACYTVPYYKLPGYYRLLSLALTIVLLCLCKRHRIQVIHCNNRFELTSAIRITKLCKAKVILNYHVPVHFDPKILKGVDAFIAPGRDIVHYADEKNRTESLGIKEIRLIPPLFDADKFIRYQPKVDSRDKWFAENLDIAVKACPVICMIGNMVPDLQHKNYPLLFEAMAVLIHVQKTPVQAMLVGDGEVRPYLESLSKTLDIQAYVHFLGFTKEHTPGILYHSDMFVLASSQEAFGIVFLEAGLMRKPAIGARKTGAEYIIVHQKTGLLFENGSVESLAAGIQMLASDSARAERYGNQAYEHVMQHFAPAVVVQQYEALYEALTRET